MAAAPSVGLSREIDIRGAAAAIASISAIGTAIGLSFPLLSLILDQRGYSGVTIGANAAMAGVASLLSVWLATPMASLFGVTRSLVLAAVTAAGSLIAFYFFDSIEMWFVLRIVFHGALTVSFVLSEFWINSASSERRRGLILGIYATILSLGFGIGPAILAVTGTDGILPFLIGGAVIAASIVPVLGAAAREPVLEAPSSANAFLRFVFLVPLATGAVFIFGAVEQSTLALLPVYSGRLGYGETEAALLLTVLAAGNVVFQIPLGYWSDRLSDRRIALYTCGTIGAAGTALLPFVMDNGLLLYPVLLVWGGMMSGLYTIGLAHLGSRLTGRQLAEANAAFVLCYTIGMTVGPQFAGIAMDIADPHGFAWVILGFFIAYLLLCVTRALSRPSEIR